MAQEKNVQEQMLPKELEEALTKVEEIVHKYSDDEVSLMYVVVRISKPGEESKEKPDIVKTGLHGPNIPILIGLSHVLQNENNKVGNTIRTAQAGLNTMNLEKLLNNISNEIKDK